MERTAENPYVVAVGGGGVVNRFTTAREICFFRLEVKEGSHIFRRAYRLSMIDDDDDLLVCVVPCNQPIM